MTESPSASSATASRLPLVLTAIVGVIFIIIGAVTRGVGGLLGGVLGALVVLTFFGVGQWVVGRVLERNPQIAMTAALLTFVLQILALLVLLLVLRDATWLDGKWFGFTVFAGIVTWTVGMVIDYSRNRRLTVVPGSGPGHPDGPSDSAP